MNIELYLTPHPFHKINVEGKTVVVIDVLRASTSICQALASGAKAVIPMAGHGLAGDMWTKIGPETAVLAGEQNGIKLDNFQLGNSPLEFTEESVKDKFVILSTTNGTPLFEKSKNAALVITCGIVNVSSVTKRIIETENDIIIACSGKDGQFSLEDTLCGGLLIESIKNSYSKEVDLNDAGKMAHLFFKTREQDLAFSVSQGEHGKYLNSIGFSDDVTFSSKVDSIPIIPVLKDGKLVLDS